VNIATTNGEPRNGALHITSGSFTRMSNGLAP